MTTPTSSHSVLERRAREAFEASVEGLDAHTRSRLNQARQAATAALERSPRPRWVVWAPAGALAAAALVAVLLVWRAPGTGGESPRAPIADNASVPVEVLVADDDLAIAKEDLDFYDWVGYQTSTPASNDIG